MVEPGNTADSSKRLDGMELLFEIGLALSSERNHDRLLEKILIEAQRYCNADGGTIYLVSEDQHLEFAIMRNDTMNRAMGGASGEAMSASMPRIALCDETGAPNHSSIAAYAASTGQPVNIADAYNVDRFDFSGTKDFDARNNYRSQSFLAVPMKNNSGRVIGVLQLINHQDVQSGEVAPFDDTLQEVVEALSSQAAVALDNQQLITAQRVLLDSFIQLIANAIDAKSPYTGGHCVRVPELTKMLLRSVCDAREGKFASFDLSEEEWYELHIAAWLHDCGKVTTPVHVMDKSTKLETIYDRIETITTRIEVLKRDAQLEHLAAGGALDAPELQEKLAALDDDQEFLKRINQGAELMHDEDKQRVQALAQRTWQHAGQAQPFLSEEEVENLCINRGTLTNHERLVINGHMVQTIKMLESLPFPAHLRRVPEYAGGHHEKMDGTGYPRGLFAGDMSVPARCMAIADVFEALTASDRPYKSGKSLSESMTIMGYMKRGNHLDPDLFDLFVTSGTYREYARQYLSEEAMDEVDEAALLAIVPEPYELPADEQRQQRWQGFLPEYQQLLSDKSN